MRADPLPLKSKILGQIPDFIPKKKIQAGNLWVRLYPPEVEVGSTFPEVGSKGKVCV